jgi:hypothetical protein
VRKDDRVIGRMEGNWVAVLFLRFLYVTMFWGEKKSKVRSIPHTTYHKLQMD